MATNPICFDLRRKSACDLTQSDPLLVLADCAACRDQVSAAWADEVCWARMSILSTARCGKFSSDRAIREYCDAIWNPMPAQVTLNEV